VTSSWSFILQHRAYLLS